MNDIQILTMAISVAVPISFLLLSNSRITDVRNSIAEAKETLRAEATANKQELLARMDRMEENIMRLLADHDQRLHKLEGN